MSEHNIQHKRIVGSWNKVLIFVKLISSAISNLRPNISVRYHYVKASLSVGLMPRACATNECEHIIMMKRFPLDSKATYCYDDTCAEKSDRVGSAFAVAGSIQSSITRTSCNLTCTYLRYFDFMVPFLQ